MQFTSLVCGIVLTLQDVFPWRSDIHETVVTRHVSFLATHVCTSQMSETCQYKYYSESLSEISVEKDHFNILCG